MLSTQTRFNETFVEIVHTFETRVQERLPQAHTSHGISPRFQRGRSPVERVQLRAEQLRLPLRARLEALGEPSRASTWCVNIFRSTIRIFLYTECQSLSLSSEASWTSGPSADRPRSIHRRRRTFGAKAAVSKNDDC